MILAALRLLLVGFLAVFPSLPAASQNPQATPTYGIEQLIAPIGEDPFEVHVQAGGPIAAVPLSPADCRGYIASAPDFDLDYVAADVGLRIAVEADTDTTLAVSDPSGVWHCSDDVEGLNPMLLFMAPQTGHYSIWIGTYREGRSHRATLIVSDGAAP